MCDIVSELQQCSSPRELVCAVFIYRPMVIPYKPQELRPPAVQADGLGPKAHTPPPPFPCSILQCAMPAGMLQVGYVRENIYY